jgi:2,4-dienoyl-CoA reductase-like NADH-dependent reductase (Old Yellow Enzyme family)
VSWKCLISAVKDAGGVFFQQLWHPGAMRVAPSGKTFERPSLSPSGLVQAGNVVGRAMTLEEMEEIKLAYVQAALITKGLGADGVEVHGAHGYLLDQFLWRETNLREDGYGGDALEDRLRFPAEVVAAIRYAVGPDFPISYRFSQWKEIDFEATVVDSPEELEILLRTLREAGADMFNVSARRFHRPAWDGSDLGLVGWAKSLTDAPVIAVGGVGLNTDLASELWKGAQTQPDTVQSLTCLLERFNRGEFDLVAVGRSCAALSVDHHHQYYRTPPLARRAQCAGRSLRAGHDSPVHQAQTAVEDEDVAGHEAGGRTQEEQRRRDDLGHRPEPSERREVQQPPAELGLLDRAHLCRIGGRRHRVRGKHARGENVEPEAVPAPLPCHGADHRLHAGGRRTRVRGPGRFTRRERAAHRHRDAGPAPGDERPRPPLEHVKRSDQARGDDLGERLRGHRLDVGRGVDVGGAVKERLRAGAGMLLDLGERPIDDGRVADVAGDAAHLAGSSARQRPRLLERLRAPAHDIHGGAVRGERE